MSNPFLIDDSSTESEKLSHLLVSEELHKRYWGALMEYAAYCQDKKAAETKKAD